MIDIVIEKPKITTSFNENGSEGEFVIEPLERGYGTTLGNSLRRVLLSTLAGYAATSIKIEGAEQLRRGARRPGDVGSAPTGVERRL